jgi:hypothetical protein
MFTHAKAGFGATLWAMLTGKAPFQGTPRYSLREAILTANQQKSASLAIRAQATLAEYRRQKAGGSGAPRL